MREDGRLPNQLRPISFECHFTKYAEGSVLAKFGNTHVLCNVTIEENLPRWLKNKKNPHGWVTAEYAMLPRSTQHRTRREQRWPKGRTQEISRLIGRSLRMALDLHELGERTLTIDCDVLQADGGTRTAAITGSWVAVQLALQPLIKAEMITEAVFKHQIAAISVGVVDGNGLLDLPYVEDVAAEVDLNVVMTGDDRLIEVQGTAEKEPIGRIQLNQLVDLAADGIKMLTELQKQAILTAS
ncbi:MAG: ribonuclease PH [Chloroflexi bacterium]|nr:MAG: ribonuclease PH [Chloroflexota bacterium]